MTGPQRGEDRTVPGQPLPPAVRPAARGPDDRPASEPAPSPPPPPRRRRRLRGWGWRLLGVALTVPVLFGLVFALVLLGRQVPAPGWLKTDIEARAADLLGGGTLRMGQLDLTLGADLHPRVIVTNAELRDRDGAILAQVPRLSALLSPRGLIAGEVLVQEVDLSALQIALRRAADGAVALQVGTGGSAAQEAGSFVGLLDRIDAAFEVPRLAALEQVRITGLIVNYDDARAGRSWTVDGGRLTLDLRDDRLALGGNLSLLSGRSYLTRIALRYVSPRGTPAARIGIDITDGVARDLASQSPALAWLGVLDAPLSASLQAEIDDDGTLGPLDAALRIGAGALRPTEATRPVPFESALAYMTFDPLENLIHFDRFELRSIWGSFSGTGRAWLRDFENGFPRDLWGQVEMNQITLNPAEVYAEPLALGDATAAFRLGLSPFELEVPEVTLSDGAARLRGSGRVQALEGGWAVRSDLRLREMAVGRAMEIWPLGLRPNTRAWFAENVRAGTFDRATMILRSDPGADPVLASTFEFSGLDLQFMRTMPPIEGAAGQGTWEDGALTVALDAGLLRAPEGGAITLPGSVFTIPEMGVKDPPATIALSTRGTLTAALSVLDRPPFEFLTKANLPVDLADARAEARGTITLPLQERIPRDAIDFAVAATLRGVRSERLIEGRSLTATELDVQVDNAGIVVSGPMRVGQVPLSGRFSQAFRDNPERQAEVAATVELSERFLDEFGIGLPDGLAAGQGTGDLTLSLARGRPPDFALRSDLRGLRLSIPAIGWSKGPGTAGELRLSGRLGDSPVIDDLVLSGPGLEAAGTLELGPGGRLARMRFPDLQVGDWLRAPVELRDRGAGNPLGVTISGGRLDLRGLPEGRGGPVPPMSLVLDRLTVAEGLDLTGFAGEFRGGAALSGEFAARLNGGGPLRGTVAPHESGRPAVRLVSDDAGAVISAAGFLRNAVGGALDLTLVPAGEAGFDGQVGIRDIRVRDAPALASLLNAISVVGLLQQLDGQGLAFSEVEGRFRIEPGRITVLRSSAVGASLGISLDGTYLTASKQMDFQGVVSPLYLINGIGAVLTRPGEGLIGFNFTLRGPAGDLEVGVNPLSVLTPGMFREIFRRPAPQVGQ